MTWTGRGRRCGRRSRGRGCPQRGNRPARMSLVGGTMDDMNVLDRFSPAARDWFTGAFAAPTAAQTAAWEAIGEGENTLVVAPTGSGKTLAAFLWALDRLTVEPPPEER